MFSNKKLFILSEEKGEWILNQRSGLGLMILKCCTYKSVNGPV